MSGSPYVRAYQFDLHPKFLARTILAHSWHWEQSWTPFVSYLRSVAQTAKTFRIEHDLSNAADDENDLLVISIESHGPEKVIDLLRSDEPLQQSDSWCTVLALMIHQNEIQGVLLLIGFMKELPCACLDAFTHIAARNGHTEILKVLLQHGADANEPSNTWRGNCLQAAALRGHSEIVSLLLVPVVGLNLGLQDHNSGLHRLFGHLNLLAGPFVVDALEVAVVCALLAKDREPLNILLSAIAMRGLPLSRNGTCSIFAAALERGGNVCDAVLFGLASPGASKCLGNFLSRAVEARNHERVSKILQSAAFHQPSQGWTGSALIVAAGHQSSELFDTILAHGDVEPWAAARTLCVAIRRGRYDVVDTLLSTDFMRNALDYMAQHRPHGCRPMARLRMAITNQPLTAAVRSRPDLIPRLIEYGINSRDSGASAMNVAALFGKQEAARLLVEAGVDPSSPMPTDTCYNPMVLAIANGKADMVGWLQSLGQEVPIVDVGAVRSRFGLRCRSRDGQGGGNG